MKQITVVNYTFLDADPEITNYLTKFVEEPNNKMINQNLINTQAGFLDSAACKNANDSLDNNIVFKSEKDDQKEKEYQKEYFNNKENMNSQYSIIKKIINWVIIAFLIIIGLLILGYSGIIDWNFNIL